MARPKPSVVKVNQDKGTNQRDMRFAGLVGKQGGNSRSSES
jgi:hypothetical protein